MKKIIATFFVFDGHGSTYLIKKMPEEGKKADYLSGISTKIGENETPKDALLRKFKSASILREELLRNENYLNKLLPENPDHVYSFKDEESNEEIISHCYYYLLAMVPSTFFHPNLAYHLISMKTVKIHWDAHPGTACPIATKNLSIPISSVEAIKQYGSWVRDQQKEKKPKPKVKEVA